MLHEQDHLACFAPGVFALSGIPSHLELAKELMKTCYLLYEQSPTGSPSPCPLHLIAGLAPEIVEFVTDRADVDVVTNAPQYLLRPGAS